MPKRGAQHSTGGGSKGSKREPLPNAPTTLADLHITKKTSMVAQQLASLPVETRKEIAEREQTLTEALRQQRRENVKEALAELIAFPGARHDDQVDSLSGGLEMIAQPAGVFRFTPGRPF